MQEIQYIERKRIHLNSLYGTKNNGSFNSNVIFNKFNIIPRSKDILYSEINLCCCEIPFSFYTINDNNNILGLSTGDIVLTNGNYNVNTFKTMINNLLPIGMTFLYNSLTGKASLNYNQYFFVKGNSTCYKIFGFFAGNIYYSNINYTIEFPFLFDISGTKNIYIKTNSLFLGSIGQENENDILHVVQNNVNPFGLIYYNNIASNFFHNIGDQEISNIDIRITDEFNNLINFNGIDWTISLQINIYRIKLLSLNKFLSFNYDISEKDDNNIIDNIDIN